MMNAKLVVVGGDAKAAEVQLKLPTIIGRGKEAGLTVPHALVSRRHTEIFEREGRLFVKDLGSLNGTFVNNLRIENETPLEPNQLLTLGNVTFRAIYEIGSSDTVDSVRSSEAESVAIAEPETSAGQPKRKPQLASVNRSDNTPAVPFDETVPIDSITKQQVDAASQESSGMQPAASVEVPAVEEGSVEAGSVEAVSVEAAVDSPVASDASADNSDSEHVVSEIVVSRDAEDDLAADTDKSFKTTCEGDPASDIFTFEGEQDPAQPVVSMSALGDLPSGQSSVSFVGDIELGDDQKKPVSQIEQAVELELGAEERKPSVDVDSSLGSFLRKLPR